MGGEKGKKKEFRHGTRLTYEVPLSGTRMGYFEQMPAEEGIDQPWRNPADEFRHGTGHTHPIPLGGSGYGETARSLEEGTEIPWRNPADEFRHGTGPSRPMPLGGP